MLTGADTCLEDTLGGLFVLTGCVCSRAVDYLMAKEQHDATAAIVCTENGCRHRHFCQEGLIKDAAGVKKIHT